MSAGSSTGGGGPCGACKFLRRKCVPGCIFAPYFDTEQGAAHFAAVHKVFGASNVSKLPLHIPVQKRLDAMVTICYEAQARLRDPVYGVVNLQAELSYLQAHLATLELPSPLLPSTLMAAPHPSISDLRSASSVVATYDLSSLLYPVVQTSWTMQQRQIDPRQFGGSGSSSLTGGGGDLQALARELLHR
ncbi:LOB domain-containing protein 18 [Hibiscus syriacus]|uniref:LOB domain-containing protein 18 n=1 Tax=Hibiscus syriacus TaxID=106335 RepID=A0A6A3BGK5_HIBSY|nr:LOB domain-containing protein 18 [Hibiscus syriacus]